VSKAGNPDHKKEEGIPEKLFHEERKGTSGHRGNGPPSGLGRRRRTRSILREEEQASTTRKELTRGVIITKGEKRKENDSPAFEASTPLDSREEKGWGDPFPGKKT